MRTCFAALLLWLCVAVCPSQQRLVFDDVSVVDVEAGLVRPHVTVIVSGGSIVTVGTSSTYKFSQQDTVIDGRGKFLLPGLWDMHVHLGNAEPWMISLLIANGVVGVREMGNEPKQPSIWRQKTANGELMPRIVAAGQSVTGMVGEEPPHMRRVANADEAIRAVDRFAEQKADFVKVHDWISRDAYFALLAQAKRRQLPVAGHRPVALTAIEASNAGQKSIEHFGNVWGGLLIDCSRNEAALRKTADGLRPIVEKGFDWAKMQIQLGSDWSKRLVDGYNPGKAGHLARVFKKNGTWLDPTAFAHYTWAFVGPADLIRDPHFHYFPAELQKSVADEAKTVQQPSSEQRAIAAELYKKQLDILRIMSRSGVGILAGTDMGPYPGVIPGFSLHDELKKLVEAGLSPAAALRSATVSPAKYFGTQAKAGTIAKGKQADLLLLTADPLLDISNTSRIEAVIVAGNLLDRHKLDDMLSSLDH